MLQSNECPEDEGNVVARVFDEGSSNEGLRRRNNQEVRKVKRGEDLWS
jgi:hypothetical protein